MMAVPDTTQTHPEANSSDLYDKIYEAAEHGDEIELRARLAQRKHYDLEQDIIDTSLGCAVQADQPASVRLLMEYGARTDVDTATTAIENAVSIEVWQALLDGGWNPNSKDQSGDPVIFNFLSDPSGDPMLVWFLSRGASAEAFSARTGLTAISWTAGYQPVPVLRALLEHTGLTSGDKLNRSNAVHEAASNKDEDRTEALALLVDELGADVNALSMYKAYGKAPPRYNRAECRPLHKAVHSGRREHVRFLLDRGARVTEKDAENRDVMTYAKSLNRQEGWKAIEEWFAEKGLKVPGES